MNVETLSDLFVVELNRMYTIEERLEPALATLETDAAVDALDDRGHVALRDELTELLADHRAETEDQRERLADAFAAMDRQPESRQTPALDGLLDEKELFNNVVLDDAMRPFYYVGTAAEIERLEVTAYERLLTLASHLDLPDAVGEAIQTNLDEERAALERLEALADGDGIEELLDELAATQASP